MKHGWPSDAGETLLAVFVCAVVAVCLLLASGGCDTRITGGQSRHDTGQLQITGGTKRTSQADTRVIIGADGRVEIQQLAANSAATQPSTDEHHDNIATTQPSARTNTGGKIDVGKAAEGELGTMQVYEKAKAAFPGRWPLAVLLLVTAGLSWLLTRKIWLTVLCVALAFAVVLMPLAVAILSIVAVLVILGYIVWTHLGQITAGVSRGLVSLNPADAEQFKLHLSSQLDQSAKQVIAAVKP